MTEIEVSPDPAGGVLAEDAAARAMIVAAVEPLFYARGFTAVGMDEVRAVTGVSLKRLYRLFPSKEDIIEEVLHSWRDTWEANLRAQVESTQVPSERLLAVFDLLAAWFTSEGFRGCAFINSFGELGGISGRIPAIVRAQKKEFQDYLALVADGVGAPARLAPQLAILAEGALTTAAIAGSAEPARQARAAAEILIDVALAGTSPTPAASRVASS
ncbi:MAG: TetR/AcrR family transcriptional regulator [Pseudarthrobacter sp.]